MKAAAPLIGPCAVARRTEPSAWLCPPPGARRMPDGFELHRTDVAARLLAAGRAEPEPEPRAAAPLFHVQPTTPGSPACA